MPLPYRRTPSAAKLACSSSYSVPLSPRLLPPASDAEKTVGGASMDAPAISLGDEFSKADATGPYASPGWSDLPIDLLIRILHLLELPEAVAFRAVCPLWRSASTAAGSVPPRPTPWLVSLKEKPLPGSKRSLKLWDPTSSFRNLLDGKTFQVSFSWGQAVALCGASHGWLIMANKFSNLVLYNPFTSALVPLPPIIGFDLCIEGVYGDEEGKTLVGYRYVCFKGGPAYDLHSLGWYFYDKVVLSGSPSAGCPLALAIHLDGKRLSSARVGDSCWQQISLIRRSRDSFADCVYHRGRFYVVTMRGRIKCLEFGGSGELRKKTVIAKNDDDDSDDDVITRYLVSSPWGRLLHIRVILDKDEVNNVRVEIDRLDMKTQKMVGLSTAKALRGHSAFVGQNNPGLLSTKEFPQLKPDCIYFTTPRLREDNPFINRHNEWNGVKVYDLKKRTLEAAFPSSGGHYGTYYPLEIWFTPSSSSYSVPLPARLLPPASDAEKTVRGASTDAPAISLGDEFSKADAMGPYASPGWSDLPIDLVIHILNLLELPEALAFGRAVCPSWRSASTAAATSVPPRRTPWLVSLAAEPLPGSEQTSNLWDPTISFKFRNLVDEKTFMASFPRGQVVACCGTSHGWLVVANELSDLILYDPFTAALVPLPPITKGMCIEGVYGDKGNVVGYRYVSDGITLGSDRVHDVDSLGMEFYDKVVLSGSPSVGDTIALAIILDGTRLSFARVGDSSWRHVSVIKGLNDSVADCVYHHGKFFVLTMEGLLKSWDLSGIHGPKRKTIIGKDDGDFSDVITRYLVSTPWGHLLEVRVLLDTDEENCLKVEINRCDLKSRKMVTLTPSKALRGLALFLGQNSPAFVPINKFQELRPDCIYFTTPRLRNDNTFGYRYNQWSGVKVYDLKKHTLEPAFPSGGGNYGTIYPSEVWFTPSL